MSSKNGYSYKFGSFRLDTQAKILYHADAPVQLKPKAVETLIVLVENAGEVVGKTDLMNAVWQDAFVEENNLSVNIYALRKAFARYDEQIYIQTVSRRGFRFTIPVSKSNGANSNGNQIAENSAETKTDNSIETDNAPIVDLSKNEKPADETIADSILSTPVNGKSDNRKSQIANRKSQIK